MPIEPLKGVRREVPCLTPALKSIEGKAASDMPNGGIEGWLAVYGNVDQDGEVIDKGTFAKSIKETVNGGAGVPLMTRHFRDGGDVSDAVGTIFEARETDKGLWIKARFASTPDAQEVRTKMQEGIVRGLSVGFMPIRWEWVKDDPDDEGEDGEVTLHFKEAKLAEGTITLRPSNIEAHATSAKEDAERLEQIDNRIARVEQQIAALDTAKAGSTEGKDEPSAATTTAAVEATDEWLSHAERELQLRGVS